MKKGFTLIELLAVIIIVAIISLVAIPIIGNIVNEAKVNSLKESANGLIDASNLYYAQYTPSKTIRFDIVNGTITSDDTDKLLKYKGKVNNGTIIINNKGKNLICVNDGNNSVYKNFSDNSLITQNKKTCSVPQGQSIVYLDNTATITELSNQELTNEINTLKSEIATLKSTKANQSDLNTTNSNLETVASLTNKINYSTEEQVVGTWIDGKPIYQRTIYYENVLPSKTTRIYNASSENIDTAISCEGTAVLTTTIDRTVTLNYTFPNEPVYDISARFSAIEGVYIFASDYYYKYSKIYVTIRYTKTTDQAQNN